MVDLSSYPFPTYVANKLIASLFASFVFLSLLVWSIRSIPNYCQPIRPTVLLFVAHLAILAELTIRATKSMPEINTKAMHVAMTALYTVGQRSIIAANLTCLFHFVDGKFRCVFLAMSASILVSDVFMVPAGLLSFQTDRIPVSFILRQISTAIVCVVTVLFYVLWSCTKVLPDMSCEMIVLLAISSFNSLTIAFFLLVMSLPQYYTRINDDEEWFYFFQILPMLLTLTTWSMLHPRRLLTASKSAELANETDATTSSSVF